MSKTPGYRKLALIMAFVLGTGLSLAACGSQSSTDEEASHPGDNYIGSIVVTVDPNGPSLDIQQINPALSNTNITSEGAFSVSTVGTPTYASNTLTGNVKVKWSGTQKLEDVRLGVFSTSGAGLNAAAEDPEHPGQAGRDNCTAYTNFGTAIAGGCKPGYTYVGDAATDGPETEIEVQLGSTNRQSRYLRFMCPECGQVTAKWMLSDQSGSEKYSFSAYLYGAKRPQSVWNDPRFDVETATITAKAYRPNWAITPQPPVNQSAPLSTVKNGEWFYVSVWMDAPGLYSRNDTTWPPCKQGENVGNPAGCDITQSQMDGYDYYYLEDKANMDMYTSKLPNLSMYGASYNTGFAYSGGGAWVLRWDPAVLRSNDTTTNVGGLGSGANNFKTKGATGTGMVTLSDDITTDLYAIDPTTGALNNQSRATCAVHANYNLGGAPKTYPPVGDGTNTYAGYAQGDINVCKLAMKAIGSAGQGTRIDFSPSGNTGYMAAIGAVAATHNSMWEVVTQKSSKWPTWADAVGIGEGISNSVGHYNEQYAWVCIK